MATYSTTSPYYGTPTYGFFLDTWNSKVIPPAVTDALYQIDTVYNLRPDLLAFDLYKNTNLWWVFAVRNPDILLDPIYSFQTGTIIYVPTRETITSFIGV